MANDFGKFKGHISILFFYFYNDFGFFMQESYLGRVFKVWLRGMVSAYVDNNGINNVMILYYYYLTRALIVSAMGMCRYMGVGKEVLRICPKGL